uniref:Uncharacterized protein n=1 Tax=Tanacetum cinerariifolium TaxID=118510 RepID=A0A6L2N4W3_TANCI|nr:hypothetical protein [Tanacetum cinerariifolium]
MLKENEAHKFSDGTLTRVLHKLNHMVKDFRLYQYNSGMEYRIWSKDDKRRSEEFIEVIERRLKIRRIFRSLESFVGGRLRDVDYMTLNRRKCYPHSDTKVHKKLEMVSSCFGRDKFITACSYLTNSFKEIMKAQADDQEMYEHVGPQDTRPQDGERSQDDDQRLDLANDLKKAQDHISSSNTSHKKKSTTSKYKISHERLRTEQKINQKIAELKLVFSGVTSLRGRLLDIRKRLGDGFGNSGGGHETRGGEDEFEGPVANCLSLTHNGYLVTFVVEEVLEKAVKEFFHLDDPHLRIHGDELVRLYVRNVKKMVFEGDDYKVKVVIWTNIIIVEFVGASLNLSLSGSRNGDVVFDEVMLRAKEITIGELAKLELNVRTFLLISFDVKTMIEFDYKSRTNRLIKSEKRLEAYSLKGWNIVICFKEGWIDESSFMKETLFKSMVRSWSIPSEDPYEEAAQQLFEQASHSPEYVPRDHVPVFVFEFEHPEDIVPAEEEALASLLPPGFLSPRTPPLLPIPLSTPSTSCRAGIPEADTPPWNRPLLATPIPGCEVEKSSTAAARLPGPTMAHGVDCSYVETRLRDSERRILAALELVNHRDRAAMRAEIEVLRSKRLDYEQEGIQTHKALAKFEAYCRALETRVSVLETHARRLEWQCQATDDFDVQHIMRTQDLEARARNDTLEDTGSSS